MKLCKFCPDCRTYDESKDGDVLYCPYCGSKLLKNYEEETIRSFPSYEPVVIRKPIYDEEIQKLYIGSKLIIKSKDLKDALKKAKKRRFC